MEGMCPVAEQRRLDRISDGAFFAGSCLLLLAIALVMAALAGAFSGSVWSLGDTEIFLRMAELIASGGTPYVDFKDPKPPLIFFLLAAPQALGIGMPGGLLLAAIANFASAALVLTIGWRLYGRSAGLLAGLLFAVNAAWAEGYFPLTEPFSLAFVLFSIYLIMFGDRHRYLLAGLSAGLAIGFKQYALLLLPLAALYTFRKGELKALVPYLAGAMLPLAVIFSAIFLAYGNHAGTESLYWSFGIAPGYFSEGSVGGVATYNFNDPVDAAVWAWVELSLFAPLLLMAVAGAAAGERRPENELFAIAAVAFAATLIIRPFLHYWMYALPFLALLAVSASGKSRERRPLRLPDGSIAFALLAGAVCTAIILGSAFAAYVIVTGLWRPKSVVELYGLADIILKATVGYFGHVPEPAAASFGIRQSYSLLTVAAAGLMSALAAGAMAWRLYGRTAGLLAGLLFAASVAFALGYMLPSDCIALFLLTLSLLPVALGMNGKYLISGLLIGIVIVIKPLAALLVPVALLMLLRNRKGREAAAFTICGIAPPIAFVLVRASHAIGWGISLCTPSLPRTAAAYNVPDVLYAMLNLAAAGSFLTVTVLAAAGVFIAREKSSFETCLAASALLLLCGSLLCGVFTHYWFMALPFASILAVRLISPAGDGATASDSGGSSCEQAV